MSLKAYQRTQTIAGSPRETEYRLFAQVTRALMAADEAGERNAKFFEAIDWNRRLWSALSTDCATTGNGLPKQLRAQIISIGLWVSRYSTQVSLGKADMDALIDINRMIMEGLAQGQANTPSQPVSGSSVST
ncbi:MAG: flagellar biosynthesis regulator FlaF [Sphingomonadales bacterium]